MRLGRSAGRLRRSTMRGGCLTVRSERRTEQEGTERTEIFLSLFSLCAPVEPGRPALIAGILCRVAGMSTGFLGLSEAQIVKAAIERGVGHPIVFLHGNPTS